MTPRSFIAAALLAGTALVQAQTPPISADEGWSAVGRCAGEGSERARHACLDDLLRRAGLLTPQAEARAQRRVFGLEEEAGRSSAAAPTKPPDVPAVPPSSDRVEAQIATIVQGNDRKLLLTTTDGAVWKQIDSDTIPRLPRAGETVRIRKASFSSYLCELPSRHTFRCTRTR